MPLAREGWDGFALCSVTVVIEIPGPRPPRHGLGPYCQRARQPAYCATEAVTGLELSCFFFQSPIAARMASSANTEQWIFTGGSDSSFTMSMFLMARASSTVLPLTHSVAKEEEAIAEPQPNVSNLASSMTLVSRLTLICNFMTSPHSGAPTKPVPTSALLLSIEPPLRGLL